MTSLHSRMFRTYSLASLEALTVRSGALNIEVYRAVAMVKRTGKTHIFTIARNPHRLYFMVFP